MHRIPSVFYLLILPAISLWARADVVNETYVIERSVKMCDIQVSEYDATIDCGGALSGISQIQASELPLLYDGCVTTFTVQKCALPDGKLKEVMDALGVTSASEVYLFDIPAIRSAHLMGLRADAVHVERSELAPDAFSQQLQWEMIEVYSSKIDLSETSFHGTTNLQNLILVRCNITHIPMDMFNATLHLKHLNLRENLITEVISYSFEGLESLSKLDLSQNLLTSIPNNFLKFIPTLEDLHISDNLLNEISSEALRGSNLTRLYLNDNKVQLSLASKALSYMPRLKWIELNSCRITTLPEDLLQGSTNLSHLYLPYNLIEELPPNLFASQTHMYFLELKNNNLREIAPTLFAPLREISQLNLDHNNLTEIPKNTFSSMKDLYYLSMTHNGLREVSPEAFPDGCGVKHLYLNENALTTLETPVLPKLLNLGLEGNLLTSIPPTWRKTFPSLKNVYLNRNLFTQLTSSDMSAVSHCELLDLSDNNVTSVLVEQNTTLPERVLLQRAPLRCDCFVRTYAALLRENRTESEPICAEPASLNGTILSSVSMADLTCHLDSCPSSCKCVFELETKTLKVECVEPLTTDQFTELNNNNLADKMTISYPIS